MASPARRWVLAFHLWSSVVLGGWFALLGVTGSVLVFYTDFDRMLNPALRVTPAAAHAPVRGQPPGARGAPPSQPGAARAGQASTPSAAHAVQAARQDVAPLVPSPAAILATLRRAYPERDGAWRIELPLDADQQVLARYPKPVERAGRHFAPLMVTLDPATLRITSSRFWGDTLMTWTFDLHYTLLLGKPGLMLTGVVGLLFALVMASGIYLWWPSKARFWTALRIVPRPGAVRRAYDMHCSSGVYWLALLLILSITGAALALPDQAKALVHARPLPTVSLPRAPAVAAAAQRQRASALPTAPISLDEAVAAGQRRFPAAEVRWIETSGAVHTPIILRMHQPSEPSRRFPQTRVWLDPDSGALLAAHDALAASSGTQATYWLHPLHNGEAFGIYGRLAVFASGFIPLLLLITGIIRWRHKVRARAIAQTSRPPRGRTPVGEQGTSPGFPELLGKGAERGISRRGRPGPGLSGP